MTVGKKNGITGTEGKHNQMAVSKLTKPTVTNGNEKRITGTGENDKELRHRQLDKSTVPVEKNAQRPPKKENRKKKRKLPGMALKMNEDD